MVSLLEVWITTGSLELFSPSQFFETRSCTSMSMMAATPLKYCFFLVFLSIHSNRQTNKNGLYKTLWYKHKLYNCSFLPFPTFLCECRWKMVPKLKWDHEICFVLTSIPVSSYCNFSGRFCGHIGNRASHKTGGSRLPCESGVCATENCEFLGCCLKLFDLLKGSCW